MRLRLESVVIMSADSDCRTPKAPVDSSPSGPLAGYWSLDPGLRYLNHGSYGATPRAVLEVQGELRARMEREPVRFLARDFYAELEHAKEALATFVGAQPEDLAPLSNATSGVNAVLRSMPLEPGDELLMTSHGYNACANALRFVADRAGARVVVADVPFPLRSPDQILEAVLERVTARTRLALLDHISSPTAIVFPIARLARALKERGVAVMVDGAHGPGMVDVDLSGLESAGVDYYTGNCHKWMCAPKGAAFLWVRRALQPSVRPVVISHGANASDRGRSRFSLEFDWVGTDDPTAFLCVPVAINHLAGLVGGGWDEIRTRNRSLVLEGRRILCDGLGLRPPVPDDCIGSIASLAIADREPEGVTDAFAEDAQQKRLFLEHAIEVPIFYWPAPPHRLVRISAQLYNTPSDYEVLLQALLATGQP